MSFNRKKAVSSILAASVLLLSACSGSSGAGGSGGGSGKVEIQFWNSFTGDGATYMDNVVKLFNESQDEIVVKTLSNQDQQKQLTAISGGNPPDLVITFWNNIGPWSEAGAVLNLEELIARDNFDTSKLIPAALDRMKVNDEIYGLPLRMAMSNMLLYNKEAFAEAGITEPPETLEQMFEYARTLTEKNDRGDITRIGFIPDYPWIDNVFWPIIFGGSWIDDNGKLTANQEANVKAIEYQVQFYNEFGADAIAKYKSGMGKSNTPQDPILTGSLAMMIGWDDSYVDERAEGGVIGVAPFPYPEDQPELANSGMISPVAMFIPAKAKNQDAAWKLLQFMVSEEAQVEYAKQSQTIPVIMSALDNSELTENKDLQPMWEFYESAKSPNLNGFPNSIYINEYLQALNEETEKALKGQIPAQQAMDNVVNKIQPAADKANQ